MNFNHPQINTPDGRIIVGQVCEYKEDGYLAVIRILSYGEESRGNDNEGIYVEFEVLEESYKLGQHTIKVWAANIVGSYSGMWHIYPFRTYYRGKDEALTGMCDDCEEVNAPLTTCPYDEEINRRETYLFLCNHCSKVRVEDI